MHQSYLKYIEILLFFLILSCSNRVRGPGKANEINFALTGGISTLDPANCYDTISNEIISQAYETLFEYHYLKRPYELIPLLASEMPLIEEGGTKYTIKIKKGIQYHQKAEEEIWGKQIRTLKAQDFITQIKRVAFQETRSPGWFLFEGHIAGINEFRKKAGSDLQKFASLEVSGLKAVDEHTLVIKLNHPYPQLLYALSMNFSAPVPLEAVLYYKNNLHDHIIGTGPFELVKWNKLLNVKMKRNSHYHKSLYPREGNDEVKKLGLLEDAGKPLPLSEKITFHVMKESQTRWLNFNAGKIDQFTVPKDNFSTAIRPNGKLSNDLSNKGIKLITTPIPIYWWLSFNMTNPILGKNKNLRLAIAHAIDYKEFIELFTNGTGIKANSIFPPMVPGYNKDHKLDYSYNLIKAKEYLKRAGYEEGKGLEEIQFDMRGNGTTHRQMGEFIKSQLSKIGLNIKVVTNTFPHFLNKAKEGKLQFWHDGWSLDYPDSENVLQLLLSDNFPPGPNTTYYSNEKVDQLYSQLRELSNTHQKFEIMKKIEEIVQQDLPWIMLYYTQSSILLQPFLKNYYHSEIIVNKVKYLRVEQ